MKQSVLLGVSEGTSAPKKWTKSMSGHPIAISKCSGVCGGASRMEQRVCLGFRV